MRLPVLLLGMPASRDWSAALVMLRLMIAGCTTTTLKKEPEPKPMPFGQGGQTFAASWV